MPAALATLFSMTEKSAKLFEAPNKAGWYVIYLNHIQHGDATGQTDLINQVRTGLGGAIGNEYARAVHRSDRASRDRRQKNPKAARRR